MGRGYEARDIRQDKCLPDGRTQERDGPGRGPAKQPPLEEIVDSDGSDEVLFEVPLL
jgi:hypothetical protein